MEFTIFLSLSNSGLITNTQRMTRIIERITTNKTKRNYCGWMILGAIARKISISCLNFTRSSNDKYELVSFEVFKCV